MNELWTTFNTELNTIIAGDMMTAIFAVLGISFLVTGYLYITGILNKTPGFGNSYKDDEK